jgi:hypothetical protein
MPLIGLERLSRQYLEFDRARVADWALLLARSGQCSEAARTTALQVCGQMGLTAALPAARQVAVSGAALPLRLSAIAAVGMLGDDTDRALLERWAADPALAVAAQSALRRLEARSRARK